MLCNHDLDFSCIRIIMVIPIQVDITSHALQKRIRRKEEEKKRVLSLTLMIEWRCGEKSYEII
jgi:hypothetical protein